METLQRFVRKGETMETNLVIVVAGEKGEWSAYDRLVLP